MPAVFRHFVGMRNVAILTSQYTDIVLNQLIQFYSNKNATNLYHVSTQFIRQCCPKI